MAVPESRVRTLNQAPVRAEGDHVLYWMVAARRPHANFALDHALAWAKELGRPLIVLEALRVGYPWASARLHHFVLQGMADNAQAFADTPVVYYPYLEREAGAGKGLLEGLAERACLVVSDDYPCFFLPAMQNAVAPRLSVRFDVVDTNGLLPISMARGRAFYSAYLFRRFLQNQLAPCLQERPREAPLAKLAFDQARLPRAITQRFPRLNAKDFAELDALVSSLPIDQSVAKVRNLPGGHVAGREELAAFMNKRYARYAEGRSHPDDEAASGLSPWLHFGHLGAHEVLQAVCKKEHWDAVPRGSSRDGRRDQFWGLTADGEAFLEEFVTFRELSFNTAANMPDFESYDALPEWSRRTLEEHQKDPRPFQYDLDTLENARTHDVVWNAAQRQLVEEGRIHNYMRMLWGKKIVEWTKTPREALERMIHLNNKYALDGRDPNSYAGFTWVMGRYDRPWAPDRPVFGVVRFMSSDAARKKLRMSRYLSRWGGEKADLNAEA